MNILEIRDQKGEDQRKRERVCQDILRSNFLQRSVIERTT